MNRLISGDDACHTDPTTFDKCMGTVMALSFRTMRYVLRLQDLVQVHEHRLENTSEPDQNQTMYILLSKQQGGVQKSHYLVHVPLQVVQNSIMRLKFLSSNKIFMVIWRKFE